VTGPTQRQPNPWIVLVVLTLGFFMILLDLTIVNIAIPSIIDGLHASLDQILWVLNAYILAYAVLLITAGRLGDMFGPKRLFLVGLAIFTLASIACSLAQNPAQLITARVVQGVGGAVLTPQTLAILTTLFPPERRGAAFGIWGGVAGVASVTGPTLGGILTTQYDWRAVFWINVPVGIVALALGMLLVPDLRFKRVHGLDTIGVLVASGSLFLGVFGLIEGQRYRWGTFSDALSFDAAGGHWGLLSIPACFVLSVLLLGVFLAWERGQAEPLVPLALFRDRNYSIGNALSAIVSFGMIGLFLPLTIFLQSVLGFSAQKAGFTLVPMSLTSMVIAPFSGRATDRFGGKYILMAGMSLFAIGMGMVIFTASQSSTALSFTLPLILAGVGLGCTFAPMVTVTMRRVEPALAGAASGFLNTARQVGGAFGGAVVGAVLQNRLSHELVAQAGVVAAQLPPAFRDRFVNGFEHAADAGLQVGPGQSRALAVPSDIPLEAAQRIQQLAHDVFDVSFINAMRPSLAVPILMMFVGTGIGSLIVRRRRAERAAAQPVEAAT